MEDFCWMGSIDYEDICKRVDDVNLWVHEEMPLNLAQLEKIYGNVKRPFLRIVLPHLMNDILCHLLLQKYLNIK